MYSLFMLWLGRRAFIRFQDKGSQHKDFLSGRPRFQPHLFAGWLNSRQNAPLFNLIGKEVRLLWPVWVFTSLGILATAGLAFWRQYADPDGFLTPVTIMVASLSSSLAVFLSGTLSMGEEKELGIQAWNMTLPIALRTQWFVKFGIALFTGLVGMGPLWVIGARLLGPEFPAEVYRQLEPALLWVAALTVVLGFWCSVLTRGTSRALLWLCPVIAMVMVGGKVGIELSLITKSHRLLTWIGFHSTQIEALYYQTFPSGFLPLVLVLSVLLAAAVQSYRLFRIETQEGHRPLVSAIIPLVLAAVLGGFLHGTLRPPFANL
jgi:hypothetical protein